MTLPALFSMESVKRKGFKGNRAFFKDIILM
jgi:hypothetical protein